MPQMAAGMPTDQTTMSGQGKGDQRGHIGSGISHFRVARGGEQVKFAQPGKGQHQEGACAGAEEAVVTAHDQPDSQRQDQQPPGGELMGVVLGAKLPLEQQENSHHRHDDQHQIIEVTLRHDHVELDSGPRRR